MSSAVLGAAIEGDPLYQSAALVDFDTPRSRILVVDDENGPRQALRVLLNELYEVETAESADAALEALSAGPVDLLMTDIRMPGRSGIELLGEVRRHYPDLPVIILTGYGELDTAMKAVEWGAFAYVEKPFDSAALLERVEAGLEKGKGDLERRTLERLALEANRFETLGRVVSGMIHDLGTPLSVVGSQIEMVAMDPTKPSVGRRLDTVSAQVNHCRSIVRTTMDFLRHQREHFGRLALNEVVASSREMAGPLVKECRVSIEDDLAPDLSPCVGEAGLIRQAILNLITNACHAMQDQEPPRRIVVRTWQERDRVCLSVSDTGPGISPEARRRLFNTLYSTKASQGTGLGLAVVKYVMNRHGGEVTISGQEGCGARFVLAFPMAPGDGPP